MSGLSVRLSPDIARRGGGRLGLTLDRSSIASADKPGGQAVERAGFEVLETWRDHGFREGRGASSVTAKRTAGWILRDCDGSISMMSLRRVPIRNAESAAARPLLLRRAKPLQNRAMICARIVRGAPGEMLLLLSAVMMY